MTTRLLATIFTLQFTGIAFARDFEVGDSVITVHDKVPLTVGSKVSRVVNRGAEMKVQKVNGKWLWVTSGKSGWVDKKHVGIWSAQVRFFSEQIRRNPDDAGAYRGRGMAWFVEREFDKALSDCNQAIRLNPRDSLAFWVRGEVWIGKSMFDQAISDFTEAIALDPADGKSFKNRARCWFWKKDFDRAIADFGEAIRCLPQDAISFHLRAACWDEKHDYDRAIADSNEAIRFDPKAADTIYNRGCYWAAKGESDQALSDWAEAIRLNPGYIRAYFNRALLWIQTAEHNKADEDLTAIIRIDPKCAAARSLLAWHLATCPDAKFRDGKRAVELATQACELRDWRDASSLVILAAACAECGEFENAVKWQERAVTLGLKGDTSGWNELLDLYKSRQPYHTGPQPTWFHDRILESL